MPRDTIQFFREVMEKNFQTRNLVGISLEQFRKQLESFLVLRDAAMEGFRDDDKQRDLSIQFHWGHNHNFGTFELKGRMGQRHLWIPAAFHDQFNALPLDLTGKSVLDIGVWTGGTSLLLCALGAEVVAIEEVKKYVQAVEFLKSAFGLKKLTVLNKSLYDLNSPEFFDRFDYILFSGVIYHVTDPVLAARIAFNALKNGGACFVETAGIARDEAVFQYEGPNVFHSGSKEQMNRGGWNWFVPSPKTLQALLQDVGFEGVKVKPAQDQRLLALGARKQHVDMNRAGLSVRNIR